MTNWRDGVQQKEEPTSTKALATVSSQSLNLHSILGKSADTLPACQEDIADALQIAAVKQHYEACQDKPAQHLGE